MQSYIAWKNSFFFSILGRYIIAMCSKSFEVCLSNSSWINCSIKPLILLGLFLILIYFLMFSMLELHQFGLANYFRGKNNMIYGYGISYIQIWDFVWKNGNLQRKYERRESSMRWHWYYGGGKKFKKGMVSYMKLGLSRSYWVWSTTNTREESELSP